MVRKVPKLRRFWWSNNLMILLLRHCTLAVQPTPNLIQIGTFEALSTALSILSNIEPNTPVCRLLFEHALIYLALWRCDATGQDLADQPTMVLIIYKQYVEGSRTLVEPRQLSIDIEGVCGRYRRAEGGVKCPHVISEINTPFSTM